MMEEARSTCNYFLQKKRRTCKMQCLIGEKYCSQHLPIDADEPMPATSLVRRRILCPLDSKHSCYEDELARHLKRCNAREKEKPVFYEKNVNSGPHLSPSQARVSLGEVSDKTLIEILDKVEKSFNANVTSLTSSVLSSETMEQELCNSKYGPTVLKHLRQNASILGNLKQKGLLEDGHCFVEFGAGRGQLSHWIIQAVNPTEKSAFVLIDRASQRHKFDNKYKSETGLRIARLKIDIEHLKLDKVPLLSSCNCIVAVGKHLCGAATDLALNCLVNFTKEGTISTETTQLQRIKGIFVALCCHHQCTWKDFVGRPYFENWGFDEEAFLILTSLTSWATCGTRKKVDMNAASPYPESECGQRFKILDLSTQKREDIGNKCKLLIDKGRIMFLQDTGLNAELIYFAHKETSLENVALLVTQ